MITSASALSGPGLASGRCAGLECVEDDLGEAGANQERHQEGLKWGQSQLVLDISRSDNMWSFIVT